MKYKANEIFVPGGLPKYTYNPRNNHKLEQKLLETKDNLCKLTTVTGITKSGKTVLVSKIFNRSDVIWFDGGTYSSESDFWDSVNEQLELILVEEKTESSNTSTTINVGLEGETGIPLIAKVKPSGNIEMTAVQSSETKRTISLNPKLVALKAINKFKIPIVIDDFHYISREYQGKLVRALKPLVFEGVPVILIAIPHRRFDAVKVEKEMTGRFEPIDVPTWEADELKEISLKGFEMMNLKIDESIHDRLCKEALGSPHLMQEFCRGICRHFNISISNETMQEISISEKELSIIFTEVAEKSGKVMFDKLARGPRSRKDRMKRILKNGTESDIYGVVLKALADMKPDIGNVDYESLRSKLKEILVENTVPQLHEISRVLDHMNKISADEDASSPVIDWNKEDGILNVTDPFFAYYLRWGNIV